MSFASRATKWFSLFCLATFSTWMSVAAATLSDEEATKLSQAQLIDHLRSDLPAVITYAERQNTRGGAPFVPDAPATLAYYTRARPTAWEGLCAAQKLSVAYDGSGDVAGVRVQSLFGVAGQIPQAATFPVQDNHSCSSVVSRRFFRASDLNTAQEAARAIQLLEEDARTGEHSHYTMTCGHSWGPLPACGDAERENFLSRMHPGVISSARFVSCENPTQEASGRDAQGRFCLEVILNDALISFDSVLVEGRYVGRDEQINSMRLWTGRRVY